MNMDEKLLQALDELRQKIQNEDIATISKDTKNLGGADVVIKKKMDKSTESWLEDQPLVISYQKFEPKRRVVITKYSKELSWLFIQLKIIYSEKIDYISKYDFYGLLAQSAIDYLKISDESNLSSLLLTVLDSSKKFLKMKIPKMKIPNDPSLPFFSYGIFKPGQICFFRIKDLVKQSEDDSVKGILKERDGIPLLVISNNSIIRGKILYFKNGEEKEGYQRIVQIEPDEVYCWGTIETNAGITANVLLGKRHLRGSKELEHFEEWDGRTDPFFKQGIEEVEAILKNNSEFDWEFRSLIRLQMAYMLLWTIIERYASLKYHLGKKVTEKVNQIAEEETFSIALKKYAQCKREVFDTATLDKCTLDPDDPIKSINYYYQVRSNSIHRGKAVTKDFETIKNSLQELLNIFKELLAETFHL